MKGFIAQKEFTRCLTLQQQRNIHRSNQTQNSQHQMQSQMNVHQLPQRGINNVNPPIMHNTQSQPIPPSQSQPMHHTPNQQQQVIEEAIMMPLLRQR